ACVPSTRNQTIAPTVLGRDWLCVKWLRIICLGKGDHFAFGDLIVAKFKHHSGFEIFKVSIWYQSRITPTAAGDLLRLDVGEFHEIGPVAACLLLRLGKSNGVAWEGFGCVCFQKLSRLVPRSDVNYDRRKLLDS